MTYDPGHLLPDDEWAAVVAEAEREAERITAGRKPAEAPRLTAGRFGTGALQVAGRVQAPSNGGRRKRGAPTFGVLHSAETPLTVGYAASIARYFGRGPGTSCHYMVDPAETWGVLDDALVAWHCGNGNVNSLALEQAGYARFSRAEWITPDGLAQMGRVAAIMRAARDRYGIGLYWMTDQQLRDAHAGRIVGGWATHDQCRRVLGGTDHTDPLPNYPTDLLMARAIGDTTTEDDMADLTAENLRQIHDAVWHGTAGAALIHNHRLNRGEWAGTLLGALEARISNELLPPALAKANDPAAIAAALAPLVHLELPPATTVTQAQLEAALRTVLGSVG